MALSIKPLMPAKARLLVTTVIAMFALVAQPFYGVVSSESASAIAPNFYVDQERATDDDDCTSPGADACLTIQGAIDKASNGHVISVAAGTYNESLDINKQVDLIGVSPKATTIVNTTPGKYTIFMNNHAASGSSIQFFTLRNEALGEPVLKLASGAALNDLYVAGNGFYSNNSHLIYADKVTNSHFKSNTFYINRITNPKPDSTSNNAGVYFGPSSNGNTFEKNKFTGNTGSMVFGIHGNNNTFTANEFSALTTTYNKVLEVKGSDNSGLGNVFGNNQVVINPGSSDNFRGSYSALSDAVSVAQSGDALKVMAGSYTLPQTTIDRNLTVEGVGAGLVTITPSENTGANDSNNNSAWILVEADKEFNLSGATLSGEDYKIKRAVTTYGTGVIQNNVFKNIKYSTHAGIGVTVFGDITVKDNTFENIERIGVHVRKAYSGSAVGTAEVLGNKFIGKGEGPWVEYGVEVGAVSYAAIKNNTFSNFRGVAATDGSESAGILATDFFGDGTEVDIEGNTLNNNSYGVVVGYDIDDKTVVNLTRNNIDGNHKAGVTALENTEVNASNNWWGHWTGPSGNGNGEGDSVTEYVTYTPWLCQVYSGQTSPWNSADTGCESVSGTVNYINNRDGTGTLEFTEINDTDGNPVAGLVASDFRVKSTSGSEFSFTHERFTVNDNGGGNYTVVYAPYVDVDSRWDISINNLPLRQDLHVEVTDTTAPYVKINSPENGSTVSGQVDIHGTVTDGNLSHYFIKVTKQVNGEWTDVYKDTVYDTERDNEVLYSLPSDANGVYRVQLAARDLVENRSGDVYSTFTVENNPVLRVTDFTPQDNHFSVGFSVERLEGAQSVTVELLDANGDTVATNVGSNSLMQALLNSNPASGISSPFYILNQTDGDDYWQFEQVNWATANEPTSARVTIALAEGEPLVGTVDLSAGENGFTYAQLVEMYNEAYPEGAGGESDEGPRGDNLDEDNLNALQAPFTQPATAFPLFGNIVNPAGANSDNDEDGEVLGSRISGPSSNASVLGATADTDLHEDSGGLFGLAWYWWLVILAALGTTGWGIAAAMRRKREDAELGF